MLFGREPVAWMALVRSAIYLAVLFGLALSPEQITGIVLFIETLLAVVTRAQVSPVETDNG